MSLTISVKILPKYFSKKRILTLTSALDELLVSNTERSKSFIYKKFYGYLMAIALRYVKEEMEAEDIVNESFIKIFRKLPHFSFDDDEVVAEKMLKSWMARITVNTSIDKLRVKKETLALDELNDQDYNNFSVTITTNLEENDILKLLNQLTDIQRSIFILYEIEGYSHEEIGEMLNIPVSTSRTYLTRAKAKLRNLYVVQFQAETTS